MPSRFAASSVFVVLLVACGNAPESGPLIDASSGSDAASFDARVSLDAYPSFDAHVSPDAGDPFEDAFVPLDAFEPLDTAVPFDGPALFDAYLPFDSYVPFDVGPAAPDAYFPSDAYVPPDAAPIACPELTHSPMDLAAIRSITPLGNMQPPGHTFPTPHMYFMMNRDESDTPIEARVYAPAAATIVELTYSTTYVGSEVLYEYTIGLEFCGTLRMRFGHVLAPPAELLDAVGPITENCFSYTSGGREYAGCSAFDTGVRVEAGDEIGRTWGMRGGSVALDVGIKDAAREPLAFANPARFSWQPGNFDGLHAACSLDYFAPSVRAELYALVGEVVGGFRDRVFVPRDVAPICGEIMQDIAGTAQGQWFIAGTFQEDMQLALAHDNFEPDLAVFSIGTSVPGWTGLGIFSPQPTGTRNADFSRVTADGMVYCYDGLFDRRSGSVRAGHLLLALTDATHLRIEGFSGTCAEGPAAFTSSAVEFVR